MKGLPSVSTAILMLFVAPTVKAQAVSAADVQKAIAHTDSFFANKDNQNASGCSDAAWSLTKQETQLSLRGENESVSADEVLRKQALLDECEKSVSGHMSDLWNAVASFLKTEEESNSGTMADEIMQQLRWYEVLRYTGTLVVGAANKVETDHLFDALARSNADFKGLVARFNAVVSAPIYQTVPVSARPAPLNCKATTTNWGINTVTEMDCR